MSPYPLTNQVNVNSVTSKSCFPFHRSRNLSANNVTILIPLPETHLPICHRMVSM